jgi:hypothetical protein
LNNSIVAICSSASQSSRMSSRRKITRLNPSRAGRRQLATTLAVSNQDVLAEPDFFRDPPTL